MLTKISPVTPVDKVNLTEAWLKVEIENVAEVSFSLQANLSDGVCLIEVEVFLSIKVPRRALSGFSSHCSNRGSYCGSSSSDSLSNPLSLHSVVGSLGAMHMDASPPSPS